MAAQFTVTPAKLVEAAENLNSLNNKFRTEVQNMQQREQALNSMWEGAARDAFHNTFATDMQKYDSFYNGIVQFAQKLNEAATAYAKAENTSVGIARSRR
ncbi:MAG: WXG100 family type VII secretion target [Lachnospiraceae bacterium]|nr:WXG100 family type VII secretion target [Lachnospiraceae bacterium]